MTGPMLATMLLEASYNLHSQYQRASKLDKEYKYYQSLYGM